MRASSRRWLRGPFLLREGSIAPWDLSGLLSTPERLMTHMLGTHHDGLQFVYDGKPLILVTENDSYPVDVARWNELSANYTLRKMWANAPSDRMRSAISSTAIASSVYCVSKSVWSVVNIGPVTFQ